MILENNLCATKMQKTCKTMHRRNATPYFTENEHATTMHRNCKQNANLVRGTSRENAT
jgi:hypothetical protein